MVAGAMGSLPAVLDSSELGGALGGLEAVEEEGSDDGNSPVRPYFNPYKFSKAI